MHVKYTHTKFPPSYIDEPRYRESYTYQRKRSDQSRHEVICRYDQDRQSDTQTDPQSNNGVLYQPLKHFFSGKLSWLWVEYFRMFHYTKIASVDNSYEGKTIGVFRNSFPIGKCS